MPPSPRRRPLRSLALCGGAVLAALVSSGGPASGIPTEIGNPSYTYHFDTVILGPGDIFFTEVRPPFYQTGGALSVAEDLDPDSPGSEREVFADFGALPFWVQAESLGALPMPEAGDPIGTGAGLEITQSFRKDDADASLSFTITQAKLLGLDSSPVDGAYVLASLSVEVSAYEQPGQDFFEFQTGASLKGLGRANPLPGPCNPPCWELDPGVLPLAPSVNDLDKPYVEVTLTAPFTQSVDLSSVGVGEEFTLRYSAYAFAMDTAQLSLFDAGGMAFLRDPLDADSGTYFETTGLTPTDNPVPEPCRAALLLSGAAALVGLRRTPRRPSGRAQPASTSA
jgi:hypothetical protein